MSNSLLIFNYLFNTLHFMNNSASLPICSLMNTSNHINHLKFLKE